MRERFLVKISFPGFRKVVQQLAFWTAAYFVLLTIFEGSDEWESIDFIYTGIFLLTLMIAVGINSLVVQPKFLNRKSYIWFFVLTAANILVCAYFNKLLFDKLIDFILPGYYFISYYNIFDLLKFFFAFVTLTTLLDLSIQWFQMQETKHQLTRVEKEKADAELKALMNQVNPHFLFNSLTVLYSLSLKDSKETSDAIIRLSEILRYVIYDAAAGKVSLKSEMQLINNYIELQRHRVHPSTRVDFTSNIPEKEIEIVPMLFLPLIENAFKHGVHGELSGAFIDIRLEADGDVIKFNIVNSINDIVNRETSQHGIGLQNIKNRLALIYKNDYIFTAEREGRQFKVELKLINA